MLNSLAGEFVDASLDLLPRGGRFIEMGKADVRDPRRVAAAHPGVRYRAFDLREAGPQRIAADAAAKSSRCSRRGALTRVADPAWDVRRRPRRSASCGRAATPARSC